MRLKMYLRVEAILIHQTKHLNQNKMTAVQQMLKELQENFPKQMADMYDSNQLLLEDIALKAKEMEKEEKIKFAKHCLDKSIDLDILMAYNQVEIEYTNQTFKSE